MPGQAGRQHAVHHVDAPRHRVDHAQRIAEPHEVPGLVRGQLGDGGLERREHHVAGLADREAADARSRRSRARRCAPPTPCAAPRRRRPARCRTAPGPRSVGARPAPARPRRGALDGELQRRDGPRAAAVHTSSTIWMSAPSRDWIRTASSGVRCTVSAVVGRPERGAVVGDLRLEREDLVAARVGEEVALPVHEAVEPAQRLDRVDAGPQHEVVRVAQHDLGAEALQVGRRQRPHRARGCRPA